MIYLDNSATTRQYDAVTEAMVQVCRESFGNPSSLHALGLDAEGRLRGSRRACAEALGCHEDEFFFTSGGTESDNTALFGGAQALHRRGRRIITTSVEHPAILEPAKQLAQRGFDVQYLPVDDRCRLDPEALRAALTPDTILISVMAVNNETGTVMPIGEIGRMKREAAARYGHPILLHCDAVQAFGKMPMHMQEEPWRDVDLLSVSGHKIHGPKGIGGLFVRKGTHIAPYIYGGGQERGLRSGTENLPAIVGLGIAARDAASCLAPHTEALTTVRQRLLSGILDAIPDVRVNSPLASGYAPGQCSPSLLNVSFEGVRGEVLLHMLEQDEIFVSTGSACTSRKKGGSHVLRAMGLAERDIEGAIRFSFSTFIGEDDIDFVLERLKQAVAKLRRLGGGR